MENQHKTIEVTMVKMQKGGPAAADTARKGQGDMTTGHFVSAWIKRQICVLASLIPCRIMQIP